MSGVAPDPLSTLVPPLVRLAMGLLLLVFLGGGMEVEAAPGLCVGPVCGDQFSRSAHYHWQLRLRVSDQRGNRERLVVDCRTGTVSPAEGLVQRGYAGALARRACRMVGEGPT